MPSNTNFITTLFTYITAKTVHYTFQNINKIYKKKKEAKVKKKDKTKTTFHNLCPTDETFFSFCMT